LKITGPNPNVCLYVPATYVAHISYNKVQEAIKLGTGEMLAAVNPEYWKLEEGVDDSDIVPYKVMEIYFEPVSGSQVRLITKDVEFEDGDGLRIMARGCEQVMILLARD